MNALSRFPTVDPNVIKSLKEALEKLSMQRNEAQEAIRALDIQIASIKAALQSAEKSKSVLSDWNSRVRSDQGRVQRNSLPPHEIGAHVRDVLAAHGKPMKRGAILRELDERGVHVVGGDRAKVLGTTIWRLKDEKGEPVFQNTPDGYWPADLPLPG